MQAELFWQDLGGTMGITCTLTRTADQLPIVDLSLVNAARFRIRRTNHGSEPTHFTATVLGTPVATSASIRHAFVPGDLAVGIYYVWGEVSIDGGTSWYPSDQATLKVVDT